MTAIHLRVATINERRCTRCSRQIVGPFALCSTCAAILRRITLARQVLDDAQRELEQREPRTARGRGRP